MSRDAGLSFWQCNVHDIVTVLHFNSAWWKIVTFFIVTVYNIATVCHCYSLWVCHCDSLSLWQLMTLTGYDFVTFHAILCYICVWQWELVFNNSTCGLMWKTWSRNKFHIHICTIWIKLNCYRVAWPVFLFIEGCTTFYPPTVRSRHFISHFHEHISLVTHLPGNTSPW